MSIERLIDGIWYSVKRAENEWEMTKHDLGNGHAEVSVRPVHYLEEMCAATPYEIERVQFWAEQEREEREAKNRERAARRAKTRVRRLVKVMGCDSLLTLTYRANQTDEALCKVHLKEFVRRMRRLIPGFCYVAAFETQKRGAWHVHMAVHALPKVLAWAGVKVKSFSVVRAVWRNVVGELGGNIDQARRKRGSQATPAKIAGYLSKYMLKAWEHGADWSNRFSASAAQIPKPVRVRLQAQSMADLIALAYVDAQNPAVTSSPWLNQWGDTFFLVLEGLPGPESPHGLA